MRSLPTPCAEISISARVHHHCAGVYQPTDQYCHGRVVYNNITNNKVMLVDYYPDGRWYVLDNINSDWRTAWMYSGSAPDTCPAHPRAKKNGWREQTCWQYRDKNWKYHDDGDITVTCSQHSKIYHKMSTNLVSNRSVFSVKTLCIVLKIYD